MSLLYRLKRLIKSDLHALVEGMEDQKWVLAQALRDMEEELERLSQTIHAEKTRQQRLNAKIESLAASTPPLERDIDFAMGEKREEIAKSFIKKLLLARQTLEKLKEETTQLARDLEKREAEHQTKKRSYEEIAARCESLHLERLNDDVFASASKLIPEESSLNHQVEIEFLKRLQKNKEVSHV
ncbi:MAG: PspA/IM30 family protein [bacterium]